MSNSWKQTRDTKSIQKTLNVGHQWVTPVKEDLYLSIITKSDRRATASRLSPDLYAAARNRNFRVTAYRRLPDKGSFIISPTACGLLTSEHRRNRLNWGREYRHWIRDLWGTVVFTFESWLSPILILTYIHLEKTKDLISAFQRLENETTTERYVWGSSRATWWMGGLTYLFLAMTRWLLWGIGMLSWYSVFAF